MTPRHDVRVLFVCLGNICRSPTAEAVFRKHVEEAGLAERVLVDSAGTGDWHVGRPPDARMQAAASARGYDLSSLRARQVMPEDAAAFDIIVAMDEGNLMELNDLMPGRAVKYMSFAGGDENTDVPDPYYGGPNGFEIVLDMIEDASTGLLMVVRERIAKS